MTSSAIALDGMNSSDDELHVLEGMDVDIPECGGLLRHMWNTKRVTLYNAEGVLVGEGIYHSVNSDLVLGANGPLGDTHASVLVFKSFSEVDIPSDNVYSVVGWPIKLVHCRGASSHNHEARDNFNRLQAALLNPPSSVCKRLYTSAIRNPPREATVKAKDLLIQESINSVSSKVCCSLNCIQPFSREKIRAFRERMYRDSTFKHRSFMKTDVYRQVHRDVHGRRVVIVEEMNVCMRAWMHIAGVSESTFYRYQKYMKDDREVRDHGNLGLLKPREHTEQATTSLKCLLNKEADHMPHHTGTLKAGDKVVSVILSASFQWKDQLKKLNETNAAFGLKAISTSNLSKIRSTRFYEYDVKKPGNNFARCGTCDKYQELRKGAIAGSQSAMKWSRGLDKHLAIARAHRDLYYINQNLSFNYPHECLTIIHDKIDHAKTASLVFSHRSKELDGLVKLPVAVTRMIAHGHGDVRYAQYGLDIFPHDLNYTIGSMAKLLQDLELPPKSSSWELFKNLKSTNLFKAVLEGLIMCHASLPPSPMTPVPGIPLPPILNVQMDNATGDNKNRYVFCFWSLLVANKMFREVYVNFMIVGHTHDDIDVMFGRWSMLLKKENFLTIPALMKSFMDVDSIPTIPHLIEVSDFKAFIAGAFVDGAESLVGYTKLQQVKFYLDSTGCPVMKYKLLCTDVDWLGIDGRGIKLWKEDAQGRSLWPCGAPLLVTPKPIKGVEDIMKDISRFIKYWDNLCNADITGEYCRRYEHLVCYWRNVKVGLLEPVQSFPVLKDGFWPKTIVQSTVADHLGEDSEDREEFGEDDAYVGFARGCPEPTFRVAQDVFEGYFVIIRPVDGDSQPFWIAKALSDPNCNPERPNCLFIQYFQPTSKNRDIQDNYTRWDNDRGLCWKVNENDLSVWEETNALMTTWKSQIKRDTVQCVIKILAAQIDIIHQSLASYS